MDAEFSGAAAAPAPDWVNPGKGNSVPRPPWSVHSLWPMQQSQIQNHPSLWTLCIVFPGPHHSGGPSAQWPRLWITFLHSVPVLVHNEPWKWDTVRSVTVLSMFFWVKNIIAWYLWNLALHFIKHIVQADRFAIHWVAVEESLKSSVTLPWKA